MEIRLIMAAASLVMTGGVGGAICERTANSESIEEKQAPILRGASIFFRWLSILAFFALAFGMFAVFGFSWFILAGLIFVATLRAVVMILIILFSKGAKPLPKWFDAAMYEALGSGVLIVLSLLIGTVFVII